MKPPLRFPPVAPELCTVALAVLDSRETADDIVRTDADIERLVRTFGGKLYGAADVADTLDDAIAEAAEHKHISTFTGIPVRVIDLEGPNRIVGRDVDIRHKEEGMWAAYWHETPFCIGEWRSPLDALEAVERAAEQA